MRQRAAYQWAGVKISEGKAHMRKKLECGYFMFWALRQRRVKPKVLLMILGRLVRCFEFRRPLMSLLNHAWPFQIPLPLSHQCIEELIRSMCVLPLAVTNLRTPVSGLVTCSDASELGGGVCGSAGLTQQGYSLLERMEAQQGEREQINFRPAGCCETKGDKTGPRILAVSLFDGIGAMVVALARLSCCIIGYASSEIDPRRKRLTRTRWPGVIELGDVTKINQKMIQHLKEAVGYKIDFVVVGAGSPCQDLSKLNATRKGLAGEKSRLFYEVPRVIQLIKEEFNVPVESFVENVASV